MTHRCKTLLSLIVSGGLCVGLSVVETAIGLGEGPAEAAAETVEARRSASIMSATSERSRRIARVRAGTKLKVIARDGRWIKVRVNGRTGWITRSNVESRQARSTVRKNRRRPFVEGRSRKRKQPKSAPRDRAGADAVDEEEGFLDDEEFEDEELADEDFEDEELADEEIAEEDEELGDGVTKARIDTVVFREPSAKSKEVAAVDEGTALYVIEREEGWVKVEDEDGEVVGWVASDDLGTGGYRYEKLGKRAFGGFGYQALSQTFQSDGPGELAAYQISSGALVVSLGGELIYDYSDKYLLAADGSYRYVRASPGIRVQVGDVASDIGFQVHEIDVAARAGYKISDKTGLAGYGRLGYRYGRFGINQVDNFESNIAYLPSEILSGPTAGVLFDMPQFNEKLSFRAGIDLLLAGSRAQTAGLEDGAVSDVSALWGLARVDYQWKPNLKITGSYQYYQSKTAWSGVAQDSMRLHGAENAERQDRTHTLFVGAGRSF